MRPALLLTALLAAGPALAGPAAISVALQPAAPCELQVEVGQQGPFTCHSGLTLEVTTEVVPEGANYLVTVRVRATSDQIDAPDLTRKERRLLRDLAAAPVEAAPTLRLQPGQEGQFFSGGAVHSGDDLVPYGIAITVVAPGD